jgi:enolase-phosphatase E1
MSTSDTRPDPARPGQPGQLPRIERRGIQLLLLDIEGTTCPVSFVTDTLFPYASRALAGFLQGEGGRRRDVQRLLESAQAAWEQDDDPEARRLREQAPGDLLTYLRLLIRRDRKLPALKELQGLVWEDGYRAGELVAPLFADVPESLQSWSDRHLGLAVYSSGSVAAQKLLYRHTTAGDLSKLFLHWFDTNIGPKQQSPSYAAIAATLGLPPTQILFISDSAAECRAAQEAGMTVLFSDRAGNPHRDPEGFASISDFRQLAIQT